jgi:hypothetical protein
MRPIGPNRNQIPDNISTEKMLNFLDAQGRANSASFGYRRASLPLTPKPQENEGGDHARSI